MLYKNLNDCLVCGSKNLELFCDLGNQPLANNLKDTADQKDQLFPLKTNVCKDCWHSQLSVAVNRELLFKHYLYVSGTTNTMVNEFDAVARIITKENENSSKKMLDIASNDGTLMRSFIKCGWDAHGIDPAENLVSASPLRFNMICDFFPSEKLTDTFDVITAFNVFAHVPNPVEFVTACADRLNDNGTLYIQTSQKNMILNGEFDTIYHEHHSFFSINSMATIVNRAGMYLHDVEYRPIHGTSYLFKIKKLPAGIKFIKTEAVENKMKEESDLYQLNTYKVFNKKVQENKKKLQDIIANSTKSVVGFGCAAKGVVRTNYFDVHHKYIVDENPLKIGKVIGGVNIRIASPDEFKNDPEPLLIIVYAWNLFDEIVGKIKKLRPNMKDEIISANI